MKLMMNERTDSTDKSLLVWNLMHKIDSNEVSIDLPAEVTVILLKFSLPIDKYIDLVTEGEGESIYHNT
jgi:hypothetical protein